jgi:glutaminyl-tRNA synthetase
MYDFTHCISDAIEKVTHSLCTLEFQDNRRLYDWVIENVSAESTPRQYESSRLNLEYTVMSKRKLVQLVDEKFVSGWDDPRMPTIAGLRRRGYTPASIREFCIRIGVTKMDNLVEMGMLEACIREDLNVNAPRAMAVLNPIKVIIENYPDDEVEIIQAPNHPNDESMGTRDLSFSKALWIESDDFRESANKKFKRLVLGKEVRLRNAYVIKAERFDTDEQGDVTTVYCTYDNQTLGKDPADGRKVKGVIHWVSCQAGIPATFNLYDRLLNQANPASADNFLDIINPESLISVSGFVEASLETAHKGNPFQFERTGYFCVDLSSSADNLVFNRTVGLRDTWAKNQNS